MTLSDYEAEMVGAKNTSASALHRRDVLSIVAATAVCSVATEGIAASPSNREELGACTAGMSPAQLQAAQNAANSVPGPRFVPGRSIPVPNTASPEFRQTIAAPYRVPAWDADPKTSAEWKALVDRLADETVLFLPNRRLPHLEISAPSWLQMPETPLR